MDEQEKYLRKTGLKALEEALEAVKPSNLIKKAVSIKNQSLLIQGDSYALQDFHNIYIIGGGKATKEMAKTLETIFIEGDLRNTYDGIINIPEKQRQNGKNNINKIQYNYATHPIPNENGVKGVQKMMKIIENSGSKDLIICLISGGGSALLPLPKPGLSLNELKKVNNSLLASGASIHEINTIRKHLSSFKGGNLAKKIHNSGNATLISLIISDVVGDNLDAIASGPTVPDLTTFEDAIKIIYKYNLNDEIPTSAIDLLEEGLENPSLENPKPDDASFNKVHNYLVGSVKSAVEGSINFLKKENFYTNYFSNTISGEAKEYGKILYEIMKYNMINDEKDREPKEKIALIGSGELTVTLKGEGKGGRNQEMLLSFLDYIKDKEIKSNFVVVAANLDGIEGNSEAMGALIDKNLKKRIQKEDIDTGKYLYNNNSNGFFKRASNEIITGPTGINVNDILIALIYNTRN